MRVSKLIEIIPRYMQKICLDYASHRAKDGLNHTQIKVLLAVGKNPGISLKRLGEMIMIDTGALSRIIKVLGEKEIIKKEVNEIDRRVSLLFLGNEGVAIFNKNVEKFENHIDSMFLDFTVEEKDEFISALNILNKYIERI